MLGKYFKNNCQKVLNKKPIILTCAILNDILLSSIFGLLFKSWIYFMLSLLTSIFITLLYKINYFSNLNNYYKTFPSISDEIIGYNHRYVNPSSKGHAKTMTKAHILPIIISITFTFIAAFSSFYSIYKKPIDRNELQYITIEYKEYSKDENNYAIISNNNSNYLLASNYSKYFNTNFLGIVKSNDNVILLVDSNNNFYELKLKDKYYYTYNDYVKSFYEEYYYVKLAFYSSISLLGLYTGILIGIKIYVRIKSKHETIEA